MVPADSSTQGILFTVDILPLGNLTIALQLNAEANLSGGSISPGETVNASASMIVPTTVSLAITYLGRTSTVVVPGVGTSYDVPIPGLGLSYLGISLGVFLNFSGVITADSAVSGPGTGGGGQLSWTTSGSDYFPVTASSSAPGGSSIASALTNISYGLSVGIDAGAQIPILGSYVLHILNFGSLGLFAGQPESFQSSYGIPATGGLSSLASGAAAVVGLGLILLLLVLAVVVVVLVRRRRRRPPQPSPATSLPPPPPPPVPP